MTTQPRLSFHGSDRFGEDYEVRRDGVRIGAVSKLRRGCWFWTRGVRTGWNGSHKRMQDAGRALADAHSSSEVSS